MRRVAVIVETSTSYGRNLIAGISRFGRLHDWLLLFEYRGLHYGEPDWLEDFHGDGVITTARERSHSLALEAAGLPVVDLGTPIRDAGGEHLVIDSDHRAVGRLAAEHLMERGHQHFAFLGYSDHYVSRQRETGFVEALAKSGFEARIDNTPERSDRRFETFRSGDLAFLSGLPKPCGLLCCWDEVAFRAAHAAIELGIAIPENLAVIGVDDDPVFCGNARIPLSSIDPDIPQMGFLIAQWLDARLHGHAPENIDLPRIVAPKGVVVRQSSELAAVDDPLVRRFLEQLNHSKPGTLGIEELAATCNVSRRLLEQRVKAATGRTPRQLLSHTLVESIRHFLVHTDYTLTHIADLLGMDHAERLSHLFRRETGLTPGEFRKKSRV